MSDLAVVRTKIIQLDTEQHLITATLLKQMQKIVAQTYQLPDDLNFFQAFIKNAPNTELALFYGEYDDLAGFATANLQSLTVQHKQHAIYQGQAFFDKPYLGSPAAAKYGFTLAMKYKLSHPEQILAHVAEVPTPLEYNLYANNIDIFYPKPDLKVPPQVKQILAHVKKQRHLLTQEHPLVVSRAQAFKTTPQAHATGNLINQELADFYTQLNPNYEAGNSLLVYVPLDISNICLGLRHVVETNIQYEAV